MKHKYIPTCPFHKKKDRRSTNLTPWTMWEEEDTILFINHCVRSMGLNLKKFKNETDRHWLRGNFKNEIVWTTQTAL